jgi:hypothetical protein
METAIVDINSAALAIVAAVPDNWNYIFARGSLAWYISSGKLVKLDLTSGTASTLSTGAEVWGSDGTGGDSLDSGFSEGFASGTWVYADLAGNVLAIGMTSSQHIQAQAITAAGAKIDFGQPWQTREMANRISNGLVLVDRATANLFLVLGNEIRDGHPEYPYNYGLAPSGGYVMHLLTVPIDYSARVVMDDPRGDWPVAWALMPGWTAGFSAVNFNIYLDTSIMSYGGMTFRPSSTAITPCDTSTAPVARNPDHGDAGKILNWKYSGGRIYSGPTTSSPAIALLDLSGATAVVHTLLTDAGVKSWSVVNSKLFYTNATGSYQADINTAAGTLGTVEPYSGGEVQAVTQ